jgi:hypothetical protein
MNRRNEKAQQAQTAGQGEGASRAGFVAPHAHSTVKPRGCQARTRQTVSQVLGPSLLVAVLSGQSALSGEIVDLARRWQEREVRHG